MVYHKHPYKNPKSISDLIKKIEVQEIEYPNTISNECIELLKELLNLSPNHRLSWKELKNHNWFSKKHNDIYSHQDVQCDTQQENKSDSLYDKDDNIFNIEDILIDNYLETNTLNKNISSPIMIGPKQNKLSNNSIFRNSLERTISFFKK